ncbi:MAG: anthranilate phosphoribosyltransferase [Sphingomonadaceae bacterium]|nr:anthranilate phosphoribosyltransferase [Sphingomonadaceae bacterium]
MSRLPDATAPLDAQAARAAFDQILDGAAAADETAQFLTDMSVRGESSSEIAAAVRAMRARMIRVKAPDNSIDVCGTGGDGAHSLNISTAVAIVVAACDVPVAKHGNRAASSKAGAADTLEALGLNLDRASEQAEATLADLGICFLFAQKHHPALAPLAPIRKALGRRTIFNLTGPLANPAGVRRQLIGVAQPSLLPIYADAMTELEYDAAMLVAGDEPLDEISVCGPSTCLTLGAQPIRVEPEDLGLTRHAPEALRGGDPAYNAAALQRLLAGETGAYRDAVLINAAAALMVAGHADSLASGVEEAAEALDKGLAKALLDCWIAF